MADADKPEISRPAVDPTAAVEADGEAGYYGQDGDRSRASTPDRIRAGADDGGTPATGDAGRVPRRDIPAENGVRASVDQRTGEVHGSGVGDGGGQAGEDFASDPATGDGYPQTGGERP